jgi:hypothetical protein
MTRGSAFKLAVTGADTLLFAAVSQLDLFIRKKLT